MRAPMRPDAPEVSCLPTFTVLLGPPFVALSAAGLGPLLPTDTPALVVAQTIALTLPRLVFVAWIVWGIARAAEARRLAPLGLAVLALPALGLPTRAVERGPGVRLVVANVSGFLPRARASVDALRALEPDVLVVVEKDLGAIPGLRRMAHNHRPGLRLPSRGMSVYCREGLACEADVAMEWLGPKCEFPVARARVAPGLCVVGVHAPAPLPRCTARRSEYVARVLTDVHDGRLVRRHAPCGEGDLVVVAGDLNAVPGSDLLEAFAARGLTDALPVEGLLAATWPAGGKYPDLPLVRIDHVLAAVGRIAAVRVADVPGTDHRAVVAWLPTHGTPPPPAGAPVRATLRR